ncbi:hypothetical protein EDB81DRAFT_774430 [Dactylonectria macrodidyma]|uniref:Uncharacterized protein n=1 Tax=Dactylonectria macrodidyma TaxID=307937 RepID=A0A9P9FPP5_9HYPO|nr:hypothetical protein EDB81DRAFT_774430 [Dactylonectria macrodidyma]
MGRLPYLDTWAKDADETGFKVRHDIEIMPSTFPLSFTTRGEPNIGYYEFLRQMDDDPMDDEYLIPGTCIRLSTQNVYGITWIYDTETCLLREWKSFDSEPEVRGFNHAPVKLPTEILGPWTEKYRKLQFLGFAGEVDFYPDEDYRKREEVPERRLGNWQARHDNRMAQLKIRDLYLECGWDVNSKSQDTFDRKRFVEMREQFRVEVLDPLRNRLPRYDNIDISLELLLRNTPEELKKWTATGYGHIRASDEL